MQHRDDNLWLPGSPGWSDRSAPDLLPLVAKVAEISDLIECLVGVAEIAPTFPCPSCRGQRQDPAELSVPARRDLEKGLLDHLISVDCREGHLAGDVAALFCEEQLEGTIAQTGVVAGRLLTALGPLLTAIDEVVRHGRSAELNVAVADGWIGQLAGQHPCSCAGRRG